MVATSVKPMSGYQFAIVRILLGVYLVQHLGFLILNGPEFFSHDGWVLDAPLHLTHRLLPNPLEYWDSSSAATVFLTAMLLLSVLVTLGVWRRTACVLLSYGWACLLSRNNLFSNPPILYIEIALLIMAFIPLGEPLTMRPMRKGTPWYFPRIVFFSAWVLMAVGFTFSGCDKLSSPSWRNGTAILHVINNPLARPGPSAISWPNYHSKLIRR